MPHIRIAPSFIEHKQEFINRHGGHTQLISLIKSLERQLGDLDEIPDGRWGQYAIPTRLPAKGYRVLGCVFIANPDRSEISPCVLFFPYMQISKSWPDAETFAQMAKVKDELGW